ncbi:hypothetical protein GCM10027275_00110 [Rhabdobacter roseus]|uniref:AraC-like DNA-binding protein n=1 Tax=Rhabdobacter roseus TaxID=1655419 RepID=A0A840TL08_9BACT|nr:AraC family transcriptional regulator [Rhabdobacter roseus]MBB5281893.1 AraC-like DNA-binding protein [Rhabdobacter roseus]
MPSTFPPIRIDFFALFIVLGVVQGVFLAYFFLSQSKGAQFPNRFLGGLLLCMSVVSSDIWLGYTNYMFRVLWLVDATEPLNFLLAALPYLYLKTSLTGRFTRRDGWHFLPALLYFVYMCVLIYPQSLAYKYNANIGSFHPELPYIDAHTYGQHWMFFPKHHITTFTFFSMVTYVGLSGWVLYKADREQQLSWHWRFFFHFLSILVVYTATRLSFPSDLGDHLVAAHMGLVIYATSVGVVRQSSIFQKISWEEKVPRKYEKSSLTPELQDQVLRKLKKVMEEEKPYLDEGFSLPALARRLSVSTHHLSQIINEELGQHFFDLLAHYRIGEAQKLLTDPESTHLKIEEIAQRVGYNSKSAFNTAFRKVTGQTPSGYRKQATL